MRETKFCKRCKQKIQEGPTGILGLLLPKPMKFFEFEDGYYCEKCAKIQVEESRNK